MRLGGKPCSSALKSAASTAAFDPEDAVGRTGSVADVENPRLNDREGQDNEGCADSIVMERIFKTGGRFLSRAKHGSKTCIFGCGAE